MEMAALIPILKLASGPAFIWLLRMLAPTFVKKLPAVAQPLAACVINVVIAVATGADPATSLAALVEALKTFLLTGGVIKTIDGLKGQSNTVTAEEKKKIVFERQDLSM